MASFKYKVIIPARGGSKRFPRKNLHLLNGLPLIAHSIAFAKANFSPEDIWVNTDDREIAGVAAEYGVNVTIRPQELGSDTASTAEVLYFQHQHFQQRNIQCDAMVLLQVTNPLRPASLAKDALYHFELSKRKSLATFSLLHRKYGKLKDDFFIPTNYFPGQRMQDIESEYFENGLIYITDINAIEQKVIITKDVYPLVINTIEAAVDIDEPQDILLAEFLLEKSFK